MHIFITQWTERPEKTVRAYFCIKNTNSRVRKKAVPTY
jgi:hypothetical protein